MRALLFSTALLATAGLSTVTTHAGDWREPPSEFIASVMAVKNVSAPTISPDGKSAVYILGETDVEADDYGTNIWWVDTVTGEQRQLTHSSLSTESQLAWHPTENAITFLTDREDENEEYQLWLLPLDGGEARPLASMDAGISDYHVSPDGTHIAVVVTDPAPHETDDEEPPIETPPPVVIDRFAFKNDSEGYLTSTQSIHLIDAASGESSVLATVGFQPEAPAFSPDGTTLAYVAREGDEPSRLENWDLYLYDLDSDKSRNLAASALADCAIGGHDRPLWRPDGKAIACLTADYTVDNLYAQPELKLYDLASGEAQILTEDLDLNIGDLSWRDDGNALLFTVEEDRSQWLAQMDTANGDIERLLTGKLTVYGYGNAGGATVARLGFGDLPFELYKVEGGIATAITDHNIELLEAHPWQPFEEFSATSSDGTDISGLLVKPGNYRKGRRYPAVLYIHGGPTSQFGHEPRSTAQVFADAGYVVIMMNPRGSTGRGIEFSKGIFAAWGSVDVPDVLAGVDWAVEQGIADKDELFVAGWSYGGMLTNYVVASDNRFKAAVSGAAISNLWGGFGTDQYIHSYLSELGTPWENPENYNRISYPFLKADRIQTPTLFMVGQEDYNVPALSSEQMYQALKVLRVPTGLVVYPGESHGISTPSYQIDRFQRHLDWFEQHRD
ncbi:hypothetical protein A3709_11890 [Halioglobus sp. HI00S01]|uniref:S9 family peptidase n=1 Tax=Halioglobus sp. HI00S01 TaxID=1822214 RepID=UPI0007C29378|nr:S9 family peptidase [Halioglobus sp. HI00S01]KZX60286.1 hypothetical protein A3709_11890 [Halioglobus sp. HI00S01]